MKKIFLLLVSVSSLPACSSISLRSYNPSIYEKLHLAQPIKITYLKKDSLENISFELYLEKKKIGYRVFGVHSIFGRIFVLDVQPERSVFEENLHQVDDAVIEQAFDTIKTIENNYVEPTCEVVNHISSDEVIHIKLSSHCLASKREKN